MIRDDVLKKRMRAGMPAPTPLFAGRVRQTLDRLPERKRVSLFHYLPAAAMAVVAVTVIGLAVASRVNPGGRGNWFQALAGGEATATTEVTRTPTPMLESPLLTNAPPQLSPEALTAAGANASALLKGQVVPIPSGTKLDFDQDGELETLTFSSDDDSMVLYIQDGTMIYSWEIDCINPVNTPYVSDIDITDGMLDLIVRENGINGKWAMYVAGYKQGNFLDRGKIPGWANSPDGNGNVPTDRRIDILMPWYDPVIYRLDNVGKLVLVPKDSYSFGGLELFTLVDIPLLSSPDNSGKVAFTVPARTVVTLWSTDNKEWIEMKTKQGTGWLHINDKVMLTALDIPSYEAFDGLDVASFNTANPARPTSTPQSTSEKQGTTLAPDDRYVYSPSDAKAAMGNNASLIAIQKSDGVVTYVVEVEPSPELDGYYEELKPSADMTVDITYLADSPVMAFVLLPGSESQQVDKDQLRASIESYDDKAGIYIRGISAKLKKADDGKSYMLLIRNENPNYQPDTDFTILTIFFSSGQGVPAEYYYTLPYRANQ